MTAVLGLAAGVAPGGDRAIVRGRIETIDPPANTLQVVTVHGERLDLVAGPNSRLAQDGKPATVYQLGRGRRVRVTYEKAGDLNRIVSLQTALPPDADLSRDVREAADAVRRCTFTQKEKYEEKLRAVVDDVDDRLDDLEAQAKDAAADARAKLAPRIKELRQRRDELAERLDRAKPAAADAWDDLKAGVGAAADDLRKALDRFREEAKK